MTLNVEGIKLAGVRVGDRAPRFTARTLDGDDFRLEDCRGKVVLIDFWATWCQPCIRELPRIRKLYERFGGADGRLVIVSVSVDESRKTLRQFVRKNAMPWTQLHASGGFESELARAYRVKGVPALFLVGPDGRLIGRDLRGAKLARAVEQAVEKLEPGRSVKAE